MASDPTVRSAAGTWAATPTAFPDSGTFGVTQRITLLSATPDATIHYTTDGSIPTIASPVFDPYVLPMLEAINDGDQGVTSTYTLKAIVVKDGLAASDVATFTYTIARRAKDVYVTTMIHPGIYIIRDFDDTKMVLLTGSERALLIDAGLGNGNLHAHVQALIGHLPLDVVITHGHLDHIAAMGQFQDRYDVYMNHRDLPMVVSRCLHVVSDPSRTDLDPMRGLADPKDAPILAVAVREACSWLVTFNVRHYQPGHPSVKVVRPGEFVQQVRGLLAHLS